MTVKKTKPRKFNHRIADLPRALGINSKREIELKEMLIKIGYEVSNGQQVSISAVIERISQCKIEDVEKCYMTFETAMAAFTPLLNQDGSGFLATQAKVPSTDPPVGYM